MERLRKILLHGDSLLKKSQLFYLIKLIEEMTSVFGVSEKNLCRNLRIFSF